VTHEYTLLLGATVLPGGDAAPCEAVAWAAGTILALGSEAEIRAISRGDSHVMAFPGRYVLPLGDTLEVGSPADLLVLADAPRTGGEAGRPVVVIRGGHVVEGAADPARPPDPADATGAAEPDDPVGEAAAGRS
jgi:hypothetical protein